MECCRVSTPAHRRRLVEYNRVATRCDQMNKLTVSNRQLARRQVRRVHKMDETEGLLVCTPLGAKTGGFAFRVIPTLKVLLVACLPDASR